MPVLRMHVCFTLLMGLLISTLARADGGSVGISYSQSHSPYKKTEDTNSTWPYINYESETVFFQGIRLGYHLVNLPQYKLNAFIGYSPFHFDASDSTDSQMQLLDDRDPTAVIGGELIYLSSMGVISASLAQDTLDVYGGLTGDLAYSLPLPFLNGKLVPKLGWSWASEDFNDYYYGISSAESSRSGLEAYHASNSSSPYAGISLTLPMAQGIFLFASYRYNLLANTVKESPMVDTDHTTNASVGVLFSF